jgi:hypothetical protein
MRCRGLSAGIVVRWCLSERWNARPVAVLAMAKPGHGKCAVCSHPEQKKIDELILLGKPQSWIGKTYGMDRVSVSRHKTHHLTPALVSVKQRRDKLVESATSALQKVEAMMKVMELIIYPVDDKLAVNTNMALSAMREYRATLELYAKLTGELNERPQLVVNIATSAEWIQIRTVILQTLIPFPDAARAVSDRLAQVAA